MPVDKKLTEEELAEREARIKILKKERLIPQGRKLTIDRIHEYLNLYYSYEADPILKDLRSKASERLFTIGVLQKERDLDSFLSHYLWGFKDGVYTGVGYCANHIKSPNKRVDAANLKHQGDHQPTIDVKELQVQV